MYVSASFSVHLCLSCPLGTSSVAMASRWEDSREKRRDWSQSSGWTDDSHWNQSEYYDSSGTFATSGTSCTHVDVLATGDAPQFGTSKTKEDWTPSLRVAWDPVELKPNTAFVRTPAPQGQKVPKWGRDKQWQARVEERPVHLHGEQQRRVRARGYLVVAIRRNIWKAIES